jgi:hypothetical protein
MTKGSPAGTSPSSESIDRRRGGDREANLLSGGRRILLQCDGQPRSCNLGYMTFRARLMVTSTCVYLGMLVCTVVGSPTSTRRTVILLRAIADLCSKSRKCDVGILGNFQIKTRI